MKKLLVFLFSIGLLAFGGLNSKIGKESRESIKNEKLVKIKEPNLNNSGMGQKYILIDTENDTNSTEIKEPNMNHNGIIR